MEFKIRICMGNALEELQSDLELIFENAKKNNIILKDLKNNEVTNFEKISASIICNSSVELHANIENIFIKLILDYNKLEIIPVEPVYLKQYGENLSYDLDVAAYTELLLKLSDGFAIGELRASILEKSADEQTITGQSSIDEDLCQ